MRTIDMSNWSRREHFEVFSSFDYPHFNMCADVDLTSFLPITKERDFSFTVALVYVLARAANQIPEFRQRIRGDAVIEHKVVHPSFTVLVEGDLFSFCTVEFAEEFRTFASTATETIALVKENPTLKDEPGQDNLLFMTAIPWVSFTSFMHPLHMNPVDSVPRIAWGKVFEDSGRFKMPLSVQGHHGLMDGIHVGRYYSEVQGSFNLPSTILGEG
jgi:chloramphenicol O-acetyltransferase type A